MACLPITWQTLWMTIWWKSPTSSEEKSGCRVLPTTCWCTNFWMAGPQFSHLPLILKPTGQGKLSKGMALNLAFRSFPSTGMAAMAMNPIQVLGKKVSCPMPFSTSWLFWAGTWQRRRNLHKDQLINLFSLDRIVKSGARFDYDKAKWYNQQYLIAMPNEDIAQLLVPLAMKWTSMQTPISWAMPQPWWKKGSIFYKTYCAQDTISLMNPRCRLWNIQ